MTNQKLNSADFQVDVTISSDSYSLYEFSTHVNRGFSCSRECKATPFQILMLLKQITHLNLPAWIHKAIINFRQLAHYYRLLLDYLLISMVHSVGEQLLKRTSGGNELSTVCLSTPQTGQLSCQSLARGNWDTG